VKKADSDPMKNDFEKSTAYNLMYGAYSLFEKSENFLSRMVGKE